MPLKSCAECGTALPEYWPKGLCAQCAIEGALKMSHATSQVLADQTLVVQGGQSVETNSRAKPGSFGDYDLIEEVARGGMGVVYKASQISLGRIVAVKVILAGAHAGREFVQRFRAEAAAAAILQHPNIVAIHDVGVQDGQHFFSMDFVEGQNLAQLVGQQPLPAAKAARYVQVIAQAIHYAHERGILHRDLKPSNILIEAATDQPRITDFGLAKRLNGESSLTMSGQLLGSPNFMPPEQAGGGRSRVGVPSDVYALGGILYFLLTARSPFQGDSLEHIIWQVIHAEPISPRLLNPAIPRDLETITLKCLEKEPARRYQTAAELARELGRVLSQEPIHARPAGPAEKAWRWCQRKPALASALGFAFAALATGLTMASWQWLRAEQERSTTKHLLYVAKMNLTQSAWEQNHISRARQILEETASDAKKGFEWYYWQRRLHLSEKQLRGHLDGVLSVAFSPDGKQLVSASADRTGKIWDVATGRDLLSLKGHNDDVRSVVWSEDGKTVATGSFDGTAKTWNALNGKMQRSFTGHDSGVFAVAFSLDARRLVTGSRDKTARIWDVATGEPLVTLPHAGVVWAVAFSPDGTRVVTASWDGTAVVWDAFTGKKLTLFNGHDGAVLSVAFSPDGEHIVSGGVDRTARIWSARNGNAINILKGHTLPVFSVVYSRDGERIVTAGDDQTAGVWNTKGDLLFVKRHGSRISSAAISPNGQEVVTAGGGIIFSPDGIDQIHSDSGDQTVRFWPLERDAESLTLRGHGAGVFCSIFSPDGRRIATSGLDQTIRIWQAKTGWPLKVFEGHSNLVRTIAFSPDGKRLASISWDKTVKIWDATTGELIQSLRGHDGMLMSVAFSPDGRCVASAGQDGLAIVWDVATGRQLLTIDVRGWVWCVAFSPDGSRIVTANEDRDATAKIWNAATGEELHALKGHRSYVMGAAWSRDGKRIVTGSSDGTARVWDAGTGRFLFALEGHSDQIISVCFSPDGQRILTGSKDNTARLWDASIGKELLTLKGHSGWIISATFSPDGERIVTASTDKTAKVWDAATKELVARWNDEEQTAARELEHERAVALAHSASSLTNRPGAITQWLVLLPIYFDGKDGVRALKTEQLPAEKDLHPRSGELVDFGSKKMIWREIRTEDQIIDFKEITDAPRRAESCLAYAVSYIHSDTGRRVVLKVSSDDQSRVYLNGELIYESQRSRSHPGEEDTVPEVELKSGANTLVFKVVNEIVDWRGSVRITDSSGQALAGVQISTSIPPHR